MHSVTNNSSDHGSKDKHQSTYTKFFHLNKNLKDSDEDSAPKTYKDLPLQLDTNAQQLKQKQPFMEYITQQRLEIKLENSLKQCVEGLLTQYGNIWCEVKNALNVELQSRTSTQAANLTTDATSDFASELEQRYMYAVDHVREMTANFSRNLVHEIQQIVRDPRRKHSENTIDGDLSDADFSEKSGKKTILTYHSSPSSIKNSSPEDFDIILPNSSEHRPASDAQQSASSFLPESTSRKEDTEMTFSSVFSTKDTPSALPRSSLKILNEFPVIQNTRIQSVIKESGKFKFDGSSVPSGYTSGEKFKKHPALLLENGDIYEGQWLRSQRYGLGKILSFSGFYYEGEWKNDLAHGVGRLINTNGDMYDGNWLNGKYHGIGVFRGTNGYSYDGEWSHDMQHGNGREYWTDGSYYEGEYKWSKKHGKGTFQWTNGERYTGEFCLNNMHGNGVYEWPDGRKFVGTWRENKIAGEANVETPRNRTDRTCYQVIEEEGRSILTSPNCAIIRKEVALQGKYLGNQENTESIQHNYDLPMKKVRPNYYEKENTKSETENIKHKREPPSTHVRNLFSTLQDRSNLL